MKKILLLSFAMMLSIMLSAQTQQGYVKTKGRLDAKGNLIPGQGLKGATVSVKGRTTVLVNTDDGAFSFPVPEAQFRLDSVRKKGYQLVDMDALSKTYKHSTNPLYLVMETPEQQLQDQLAAERKIRRTLTNQLHQREDEIEALKEQQKISDEEYRQALQKLYEDVDQNEQLVKDMVERYSKIDYDQLSKFDQKISELILNGELTKADSMLRTKGDINERVLQYKKHEAINAKEKEELTQRGTQLKQSEALAIQERNDIANDCYRRFEICKMKHENDSAAYWIKLRSELDSTELRWQNDAGEFFMDYIADYKIANEYYWRIFQQSSISCVEQNEWGAISNYNMGILRLKQGDYDNAMTFLQKALSIREHFHDTISLDFANTLESIGVIHECYADYNNALKHLEKALAIRKENTGEESHDVALSYDNIGYVYSELGNYDMALNYYMMSLSIFESNAESLGAARCYNNIGSLYTTIGDYEAALSYLKQSEVVLEQFLGIGHPDIAIAYGNIATIYAIIGDQEMALDFYNKSLIILKKVYGEYHKLVAETYNNIGLVYDDMSNYDKAIDCFKKALTIQNNILTIDHPEYADTYNNLGATYYKQGNYNLAMEYLIKALDICKKNFGNEHPDVAFYYKNIGNAYSKLGDESKAIECYSNALSIYETTTGCDNYDYARVLFYIGQSYYSLQDLTKALNYYTKALPLFEENIGKNHPNTINLQTKISELKEQENQQNE